MPYSIPAPPHISPSLQIHDQLSKNESTNTSNDSTRNHRRSNSTPITFSTEKGDGAFTPLSGLPRRRVSLIQNIPGRADTPSPVRRARAQFSLKINDEDDSSSSSSEENDSVEEDQEVTKIVRNLSLSLDPPPRPTPPPSNSPVPFPQLPSSGPPSPSSPQSSIPKVPSVILANGKPLKSSLKSASAPNLPDELRPVHLRAASAPSTPLTQPKNVHFKDEKDGTLESVKVFRKSGRPSNINYSSGNEETETEGEMESMNSFPFPSLQTEQVLLYKLAESPVSSIIPMQSPSPSANVYLESVTVPQTRPPILRGSILVKNITFAKSVAVRFTFDEWQTTSEVLGNYVTSLPSLPPPFSTVSKDKEVEPSSPSWDWATSATQNALWDRFSFSIKLEDMERKLPQKKLFCAVRYQAHGTDGGEWWDNNNGQNYSLAFTLASTKPIDRPRPIPAYKPQVNEMFNPASSSPSFPPSRSRFGGDSMLDSRPGLGARSHSNPTVPTFLTLGQLSKPNSKSKLRLSNYIPPSTFERDDEDGPTPPSGRQSITPADFSTVPPSLVGGMPATAPEAKTNLSPINSNQTPKINQGVISSVQSSKVPSPNSSALFADRAMASSPDNMDDPYSQLVKNFCFHRSTPTTEADQLAHSKEPWHDTFAGQHTMLMSL